MSLQRNMTSTIGMILVNLEGLPCMSPKCGELMVHKRLRTVGEFLPTPEISTLGDTDTATLPHARYITDSRQTLARVMKGRRKKERRKKPQR